MIDEITQKWMNVYRNQSVRKKLKQISKFFTKMYLIFFFITRKRHKQEKGRTRKTQAQSVKEK